MFRPTVFRCVGLVAKPGDARVAATLGVLIDLLTRFGIEVRLDEHCVTLLEGGGSASRATLVGDDCDLVIAVGGDGTLLRAAHLISSYDVRLLGVNMGHLGFLADIAPEEVEDRLAAILHGDFVEEKRLILRSTVLRGGQPVERRDAINDVVIHKWGTARLITLDTYVDDDFVHSQRSDGIIVSTPTGSTAYALSCGGPIVHPALDALVIVPLCPHSLSNRPIVVGGDSRIEIEVKTPEPDQARLTCDGEIGGVLRPGDRVSIEKGEGRVRLVHPAGHDHFAALRAKLQWGQRAVDVDAGIGGAIAEIVAREYVTHLPRMASLAHQHVQVAKSTRDGMAATTARTLDACGRVEEVAPVLGGVTISRQTPRYAEDAVPAAP